MKIGLTGATGFIGKLLLKRLSVAYGNDAITPITSTPIDGYSCILYDIKKPNFNFDKIIACDVLIHAGAYTPKNHSEANLLLECDSNIFFTEKLLSNLDFSSCKKIINISTLDVYKPTNYITETSAVMPESLYGMSKLYCEKMIHTYCENKGIASVTLRVGHVYGPGEEAYKKVLPVTMHKIIKGDAVEIWGDGSELRSFIYIDDVVSSIVKSIDIDLPDKLVNVASSNAVSIKELIDMIIAVSGRSVDIRHLPALSASRDFFFDTSLMQKYLLPVETDLKQGLKKEYSYMVSINESNI